MTDPKSLTFPIVGRDVRRIGFGAMQLPGPRVSGPPRDRDEAIAVLRRAVELGVNHIDTAQYYGPDVSNELIRAALFPYPDDLVLVSKVGAARDEHGAWLPAQEPAELRAGVEANLRSLSVERLDAVNLRLLDPGDGPAADFDKQLDEMSALQEEGKIGGIGLSNVSLGEFRHAAERTRIACVQNAYNLLSRGDEPLLQLCRELGIPYVPYFPLGSAFPGMAKVTDHPEVRAAADHLGATASQVGLAWLLGHAENILLIPGTSRRAHLEENLAAGAVALDAHTTAVLDAITG
jgi:pyridoxine 4-dehydrogenase